MLRESLRFDICPQVQAKFQAHYAAVHHVSLAAAHSQTVACGPGNGATFLFIPDLTNTAHGVELIVLIILYVGTQLGSSLMMSAATMDRTQRQIMLFMPLIFVLFVIRFPAGVLVYWITTNLWTIGQQYVVKRRIGPVQAATPAAGAEPGTGPPRGGGGPPKPKPEPNGSGGGGIGAMIRKAATKPAEKEPVASGARGGAPPRPPRKKKKRSGRRR
jgi:YidC/Oxa1 family membrane protein insertase